MKFKRDSGTAGLTILLSLVVMLFAIGLIVMVLSIMSGKMADTKTLYTTDFYETRANETVTTVNSIGDTLTASTLKRVTCLSVMTAINATSNEVIPATNYSITSGCVLTANAGNYNNTDWKVTYNYTFWKDTSGAVDVINQTTANISTVVEWFDIFVVLGAMVVLIMLVVLIIFSIRNSGMIGGEQQSSSVGTA